MKTRIYLDTRNRDTSRPCPLYLCIARRQKTAFFPLDIYVLPSRWDARARRLRQLPASVWAERQTYARIIDAKVAALEVELMKGEAAGELHGLSAIGVRDWLRRKMQPQQRERTNLADYVERIGEQKQRKETQRVWSGLVQLLRAFAPSADVEDLDVPFIRSFALWLEKRGYKHNSIVTRLCTLRAATRAALDDGLIDSNPFFRFPLRIEETRKRALSVDALRRLIATPPTFARDYFVLSFLLLGINPVDIFDAKKTDFDGERLRYRRAKTKKLYSVRVFPEALVLLRRHEGRGEYLFDARDTMTTIASFNAALAHQLKEIGKEWTGLSMYWARHSWATIAANDCDVPQDVISHALGHSTGARVTQTYVDFDLRKVDAANRAVIDFVLYGKKEGAAYKQQDAPLPL